MAWRSSPEAPINVSGWGRIATPLLRLVVCIAVVVAIAAVLHRVPHRDRPLSTILCFLVVVLIVSARWGFRYAIFVSLIAALAFAWLVRPVGRLTIRDLRDLYALIAFLVIGGTASHFSDRARREALNAQRAEEAARRSEKELRDIVETIPAMAFSTRPDGSTEFVNRRVLEYTGLSAENISGPGSQSTVHPEDLEQHRSKWRSSMASGEPFENEVRHRSASGENRWFLVRALPLRDEHGKVLKWYGSLTDIEDRKRAEQALRRSEKELRDVIETIPAMAWTTLPDGANDFTNQSWLEYTGIKVQDASGAGWKEWFHPADIATHAEKWRESVATGKPFENEARALRARDGEYRWFLHRAVPLRDENGSILKWYGISTDIDDRKRAEALLTGEKRILEMVAKGDPLAQILDSLCRLVEEQASGVLTSILLVEGNCLRHGGAPSLPKAYTDAIDGIAFGPSTGSCGTAAYRGQQVIVEDIATDPLWADYRSAALPHSLRACWSTPIFSSNNKVIATFAMYYREPRRPSPRDQEIIEQITHLAGIAIERKQTQDALQRSEAYLAEAQRLTHTGSWVWDVKTKEATYLSDEWYRIYGFDPPSDRRAWNQRLQRIHPEDRGKWGAALNRAINEKSDYEFDYRLLLPDGVIKYIHVLGHPVVNSFGDVVQFMGNVTDISERKRAEEALQRSESYLAEAQRLTHTGSWAWDPLADKVLYWSEEMFRIFGLDPQDGVPIGPRFGQRLHPEDQDRVYEYLRNSVSQKRDYLVNHRIVLPDGTVRNIETIGHPVLNSSGELLEYIGTAVDITERKVAERERERLYQLEADLAHTNRVSMMGELAASLAHEVKQPITAAATNARTGLRWLHRQPPDIDEARETISRIVKDVTRAADIIDRNRSLYRRNTPQREMVNLNELIREMIALLHDAANRQSISIRAEVDGTLPPITADRVQMQQVLMNLMLNGIEAMKDTGGELTIGLKRAEDGQIQLSVSDGGIGLPVENAERIFDAFFSTKAQGTGMGLSISRRIIESHGGRLWGSSNSGRGATFHFTVPAEIKAVATPLERTGS